MAGKSDFTPEEWETLHRGVTGAGLLVSVADPGFFEQFKEAGALARHLADARKDSQSQLLQELAQERGTGFSIRTPRDELERGTLESLRSAVSILQQKAPDELEAYRSFVLDVAESVAKAAGGVDPRENEVLARIREALGAAAPAA
jgi:tellurite resistance protein